MNARRWGSLRNSLESACHSTVNPKTVRNILSFHSIENNEEPCFYFGEIGSFLGFNQIPKGSRCVSEEG